MATETLNKTIVKFKYKGKLFEVDYLTDADRENYKTFHLYNPAGDFLGEFETTSLDKKVVERKAKSEIDEYCISY